MKTPPRSKAKPNKSAPATTRKATSSRKPDHQEGSRITRAYGFNPHPQQARTNEEDEDAEEGLWSTDPIWQADLNGKTSLKEASYHYLVTDHLGTPVLALNKAGETTWKARYEAFGKARIDHASTAQINLRLPGQYFDAETGLHQNWNRDYAPGIGRYVQADPIGLAGGINVYGYAYGNPVAFYDPSGEFVPLITILLRGTIGGLINMGTIWALNGIHGVRPCSSYKMAFLNGFVGGIIGGVFGAAVTDLLNQTGFSISNLRKVDWISVAVTVVGGKLVDKGIEFAVESDMVRKGLSLRSEHTNLIEGIVGTPVGYAAGLFSGSAYNNYVISNQSSSDTCFCANGDK